MKTVYLMRLWRDGTISVVFVGSLEKVYRYIEKPDWLAGIAMVVYRGRHWISDRPMVKPK